MNSVGHGPVPLFQGDLPLGPMHHVLGNARRPASLPIRRPVLRQEQLPVDQTVEVARHVGQMNRHGAVFHLAQTPAPLPLDAGGLAPFLDMGGLVDHADRQAPPVVPRNVLLQKIPHPQVIPFVQGQKVLQVARPPARRVGHRLHALARQSRQLPQDVRLEMLHRLAAAKATVKLSQERVQHRPQSFNLSGIHAIAPLPYAISQRSHRIAA
jgi:hypothetical protein